jgi:hypothetical protein
VQGLTHLSFPFGCRHSVMCVLLISSLFPWTLYRLIYGEQALPFPNRMSSALFGLRLSRQWQRCCDDFGHSLLGVR